MQGGYFEARLVKFEPLELRGHYHSIEKAQLGNFGLVRDGCKTTIQTFRYTENFSKSVFIVKVNESVKANGYFFETSNASAEFDPMKWIVKASLDNGSSWREVGASVWRLTTDGTTLLYPQLPFKTTVERTQATIFDLRPPWHWCMVSVIRGLILLIGTLASLHFAITGREESAKYSWILMFSVLGLCFILSAVGCNWAGLTREASEKWIYVPECFVIPIGLSYFESRFIATLFLFSALGALNSLTADCIIYGENGRCFYINSLQNVYIFIFTLLFATLVTFFHLRILRKARVLILEDKNCYDRLWSNILLDPATHADLQMLKSQSAHSCLDDFGMGKQAGPRQYSAHLLEQYKNNLSSQMLQRRPSWQDILENLNAGDSLRQLGKVASVVGLSREIHSQEEYNSRIKSLDQLFIQAYCLHPLLIKKVKQWAVLSKGFVKVDFLGRQAYTRYSDLKAGQESAIKWCKVKSFQRAIEKVVRAYGQVCHCHSAKKGFYQFESKF